MHSIASCKEAIHNCLVLLSHSSFFFRGLARTFAATPLVLYSILLNTNGAIPAAQFWFFCFSAFSWSSTSFDNLGYLCDRRVAL